MNFDAGMRDARSARRGPRRRGGRGVSVGSGIVTDRCLRCFGLVPDGADGDTSDWGAEIREKRWTSRGTEVRSSIELPSDTRAGRRRSLQGECVQDLLDKRSWARVK